MPQGHDLHYSSVYLYDMTLLAVTHGLLCATFGIKLSCRLQSLLVECVRSSALAGMLQSACCLLGLMGCLPRAVGRVALIK
jgi:hypothetical protein